MYHSKTQLNFFSYWSYGFFQFYLPSQNFQVSGLSFLISPLRSTFIFTYGCLLISLHHVCCKKSPFQTYFVFYIWVELQLAVSFLNKYLFITASLSVSRDSMYFCATCCPAALLAVIYTFCSPCSSHISRRPRICQMHLNCKFLQLISFYYFPSMVSSLPFTCSSNACIHLGAPVAFHEFGSIFEDDKYSRNWILIQYDMIPPRMVEASFPTTPCTDINAHFPELRKERGLEQSFSLVSDPYRITIVFCYSTSVVQPIIKSSD